MRYIIHAVTLLSLCVSAGCVHKKSDAEIQHEQWLLSLNDSISLYQKQIEEVSVQLSEARNEVGEIIEQFEYVSNPREVEGYYILKDWKSRYPLSTTGIIARVTEDERFELIATLVGAHFNEIAVTSGSETVSSGIVPHDQALNYRTATLNKVCFSCSKADSLGQFIASSSAQALTLSYLEGKPVKSIKPDKAQIEMVCATWNLWDKQTTAHRLEKELPLLSGKIAACRRMLDRDSI